MSKILREVDQLNKLAGHNRLELLLFRLVGRQLYGINVFKVKEALERLRVLHTSLSGVFNESMIRQVGANSFQAKYEPDDLAMLVHKCLLAHRGEQAAISR